jgi:branched-chain amino acid transport system ATP-binding protein
MSASASVDNGSSPAASSTAALDVRNLVGGYENVTVLRDVSLTVPAGSVVALLGPNGAGKSTLLKMVSGVIRPTAGSIVLGGEDVTRMPPYQRSRARSPRAGGSSGR